MRLQIRVTLRNSGFTAFARRKGTCGMPIRGPTSPADLDSYGVLTKASKTKHAMKSVQTSRGNGAVLPKGLYQNQKLDT